MMEEIMADKKLLLMVAVLGALLVFSVIQAVQVNQLTSTAANLDTKIAKQSSTAPSTSSGQSNTLSQSLANVDGMVGGC